MKKIVIPVYFQEEEIRKTKALIDGDEFTGSYEDSFVMPMTFYNITAVCYDTFNGRKLKSSIIYAGGQVFVSPLSVFEIEAIIDKS